MSLPYVGEIRLFAGNFAPVNWAFCDGSLLSIAQNTVLFALIGTTYGGDGQTTFALPDLRGRVPVHIGTLGGGSTYPIGATGGQETVQLTAPQMPAHNHAMKAASLGISVTSSGKLLSTDPGGNIAPWNTATSGDTMNPNALGQAGSTTPHENMQPFLAISYIISLFGVFPSQN